MGRDIAGSKETVSALSREMLLGYLSHQYVPNNTVVSVAGDIGHEEVLSRMSEALGDWAVATPHSPYPTEDHQEEAHIRIERRDTEQAHICLALRGLPVNHPDRFHLDLLNVILGEGMSSRLYQEIRERRGLAYDIHSYVDHFLDSGALTIYAGVDPKNAADTIAVMIEVLSRLKEGVPDLELTKAKELAKGRLLLRMEDSRSVAGWLGGQELLTGQIRTVDEVASIIDASTPQDLQRVASQLLLTEKINLAIVGSVSGEDSLNSLLRL
jgi:predicted Zn-dependent peptidase